MEKKNAHFDKKKKKVCLVKEMSDWEGTVF